MYVYGRFNMPYMLLWGLQNIVDELSPSLQLTNGNATEMKQMPHGHSHALTNKSIVRVL